MPLTLTCPRCSANVSVDEQTAGQYVYCQSCKGHVWVPPVRTASSTAMVGPATTAGAAPAAPLPSVPAARDPMAPVPATGGGAGVPPVQSPPTSGPPTPPIAGAPPPAPPPQRVTPVPPEKTLPVAAGQLAMVATQSSGSVDASQPPGSRQRRVAKVVTADVANSRLQIGAEGELPALTLAEGSDRQVRKGWKTPTALWQWMALAAVSLGLCALMLMIEEPGTNQSPSRTEAAARRRIKQMYLGSEGQPLKQYQRYLREAQLAQARGDGKTERRYYRQVLSLLRAEHLDALYECGPNDPNDEGVTGQRCKSINDDSQPSDQDLERLLLTLLKAK